MKLTTEQFERVAGLLPEPRSNNVKYSNRQVLEGIPHMLSQGCKWRGLPERFGKWEAIYARLRAWTRNGVLGQVLTALQGESIRPRRGAVNSLDSTVIKVHPNGTGARRSHGPQAIGKSRGGWTTKLHVLAANARTAIAFSLSEGQANDAPQGRKLLERLGPQRHRPVLVMDRAYEDNRTRELAGRKGFRVVVPPSRRRKHSWKYSRKLCKQRNQVERLFRRLKESRRVVATRYDKLEVVFLAFVTCAFIFEAVR